MNRSGGTILLGVNDQKQLTGVDPLKAETMCKDFASLSNNPNKIDPVFLLYPSIVETDGKKLIHVFVPASSQVHKSHQWCPFKCPFKRKDETFDKFHKCR